ncbi:Ig-like domain-containing protein [Clostridium sp. JNZ J1-5]
MDDSVRFTSNNNSVATVNYKRIITGVAQGEAVIRKCIVYKIFY